MAKRLQVKTDLSSPEFYAVIQQDQNDEEKAKCYAALRALTYNLLGKSKVVIDLQVVEHNILLTDDEQQELMHLDRLDLGTPGKKITKTQVENFLNDAKKHMNNPVLNNGRSYFFEGIEEDEGIYTVLWGS